MTFFEYPPDATPISLDDAKGLILTHITTQKELNHWEQINIVKAVAWVEQAKPNSILNDIFIKKLHKRMFGEVWRWAGSFRKTDKNLGIHWYQISEQLKNLYDDVEFWLDSGSFSSDEMAVRLHHRLVWIHPFPNGNGRHARLMADIFLKNVLESKSFSWGGNNLSDPSEVRKRYIDAIHVADAGDFNPLIDFARS